MCHRPCMLILLLLPCVNALTCFDCHTDNGEMRCASDCSGDACVVWKWETRGELLVKQGCVSALEPLKRGCRRNHAGATMCICDHESHCNRVEKSDLYTSQQPVVRLPAVQCITKIEASSSQPFSRDRYSHWAGGGEAASRRGEHRHCHAHYCHYSATELIDRFGSETVAAAKCADRSEFDFDFRLDSALGLPGLRANACYRLQSSENITRTECFCSKNLCNSRLPVPVGRGDTRCYAMEGGTNISQVHQSFCSGDVCIVRMDDRGRVTKGCLSIHSENGGAIALGEHRAMRTTYWLCRSHLCNLDLDRMAQSNRRAGRRMPAKSVPLLSTAHHTLTHLLTLLTLLVVA